jgi:glucosylceramidase
MELVGHLMPPRLKAAGLNTKMWLYDHNYQGWKRVLYMLSDPEVAANLGAVAWHPYDGFPEMMNPIREQFPNLPFHLTEKGPNYRKGSPESHLLWWSRTITKAINNGCSSFVGWNYTLDENGSPNLGNFKCAGLVEIHSRTGEITPSIQYHAFKHYAPYIQRGAEVLKCPVNFPVEPMVDCLLVRNPDGSVVAVVGNGADKFSSIQFKYKGKYLKIYLPEQTMTTIVF